MEGETLACTEATKVILKTIDALVAIDGKRQEETDRLQIREQTKMYIARLECETKIIMESLNISHEERMALIGTLSQAMMNPDMSDRTFELCKEIINSVNSGCRKDCRVLENNEKYLLK